MLNYEALIEIGEELAKRGGDAKYFAQKEIGAETTIRLMPPTIAMDGKYFVEERVYWIAQKKYVTGQTFGGPDPLEEEMAYAKSLNDPQINALLGNWQAFSKTSNFIVPILLLDVQYKGKTVTSVTVVDECVKYMSCGKQLIQAINSLVTNRHYMTGELGLMDPVTGRNLCLTKTGQKKDTKYSAIVEPEEMPMPESYYDFDCPVEMIEKSIAADETVVAAFRNYIYGEPFPEPAQKPAVASSPAKPVATKTTPAAPVKTAPVVGPKPVAKPAAPAQAQAGRKSIREMMEQDDD